MRRFKKAFALILSLAMILTFMPLSMMTAFADEPTESGNVRVYNGDTFVAGYDTLSAAVSDDTTVADYTVKLYDDIDEGAIVAISKAITLDLNGHTLRGTLKATSSKAANYVLSLSAPVTILGNNGSIVSDHGYGIAVLNGGSLDISDAAVTAGDGVYTSNGNDRTSTSIHGIMIAANNAGGTLTVDNCTVSSTNVKGWMNGINMLGGTQAAISNSTISGCGYGVNFGTNANGTYNISNCVLNGGDQYNSGDRPGLGVQSAATVNVTGEDTVISGTVSTAAAVAVKKTVRSSQSLEVM